MLLDNAIFITELWNKIEHHLVLIVGYGAMNTTREGAGLLRWAEIKPVRLEKGLPPEILIVGDTLGKNIESGDSGGPVFTTIGQELVMWGINNNSAVRLSDNREVTLTIKTTGITATWIKKSVETLNSR